MKYRACRFDFSFYGNFLHKTLKPPVTCVCFNRSTGNTYHRVGLTESYLPIPKHWVSLPWSGSSFGSNFGRPEPLLVVVSTYRKSVYRSLEIREYYLSINNIIIGSHALSYTGRGVARIFFYWGSKARAKFWPRPLMLFQPRPSSIAHVPPYPTVQYSVKYSSRSFDTSHCTTSTIVA